MILCVRLPQRRKEFMDLFDVCLILDTGRRITRACFSSGAGNRTFFPETGDFVGKLLSDVFPELNLPSQEVLSPESGSTVRAGIRIDWLSVKLPDGWLLAVKQEDITSYLLARALDEVQEGIQIYDRGGSAVFFNRCSRKINGIRKDTEIRGKHLLDLYDLSKEYSTTLTCLSTGAPVINRVDRFRNAEGKDLLTVNTSYPIFKNREVAGAVAFEANREIADRQIRVMQESRDALKNYKSGAGHHFNGYSFDQIVGHSRILQDTLALARRAAQHDCSVLLVGETGTGKEMYAQSIHKFSSRKDGQFLAINCAAIPENLLESMLFGTVKGSFTGSENHPGYLEQADGGTIFLDELNSMSMTLQSKLLRVLQEKTFRRLGGTAELQTDVRFLASCNENPFHAIAEKRLRQDLFYRISTMMVELPPLRERPEDLEDLIDYYLRVTAYQYVRSFNQVDPAVMELFRHYSWPGNIRELFHVLDHAENVSDDAVLRLEYLPAYLLKEAKGEEDGGAGAAERADADEAEPDASGESTPAALPAGATLETMLGRYEEKLIREALRENGMNVTKTAERLGLRRQSLQYRIQKYGIVF